MPAVFWQVLLPKGLGLHLSSQLWDVRRQRQEEVIRVAVAEKEAAQAALEATIAQDHEAARAEQAAREAHQRQDNLYRCMCTLVVQ